jgi:D-glycero-alpha-D-manno-heptose-7-phosphate kinase
MIISKCPMRVSFCGGGSDFESFYRISPGAVVSTTIDKYTYVTINRNFDHTIRLKYSTTETVDKVSQIKNNILRSALTVLNIKNNIEITSMADIPDTGTGLGSSSAFTVAVLHAINAFIGKNVPPHQLAELACHIEINMLGSPIGKQDQYAVAHGGLNFIEFLQNGEVIVNPIVISEKFCRELNNNLLLFYTGISRKSGDILSAKRKMNNMEIEENQKQASGLAHMLRDAIYSEDLDRFSDLLMEGWEFKKQAGGNVTNRQIDEWYQIALDCGAKSGKLLGAGGGGFFLFFVPKNKRKNVIKGLKELTSVDFTFETQGSRIIFVH